MPGTVSGVLGVTSGVSGTVGVGFGVSVGGCVVEGDEAELLGRPQDDVLGDPGQVHPDHRGDEGELRCDVPGGRAVDGVLHRSAEAEVGSHRTRVKTQRRPGESTRPIGGGVGASIPVAEPIDIADQGPHVGQEMV